MGRCSVDEHAISDFSLVKRRQQALSISLSHTQLDPFASKLTIFSVPIDLPRTVFDIQNITVMQYHERIGYQVYINVSHTMHPGLQTCNLRCGHTDNKCKQNINTKVPHQDTISLQH